MRATRRSATGIRMCGHSAFCDRRGHWPTPNYSRPDWGQAKYDIQTAKDGTSQMIPEHPAFVDYLDFTYSQFGTPTIESSAIRLPVRELWVQKGFPNHDKDKSYKEAVL